LKRLPKRYRSIKADLNSVIDLLKAKESLGDQLSGISFTVMKVRLKNSNIQKGKSGGYRLVYWQTSDDLVVLLDIYSKSDRANIDTTGIYRAIRQFEADSE